MPGRDNMTLSRDLKGGQWEGGKYLFICGSTNGRPLVSMFCTNGAESFTYGWIAFWSQLMRWQFHITYMNLLSSKFSLLA
jgi:hypothetical protein